MLGSPAVTPAHPFADQPPMEALLAIMAQLRDPEHGCPWDVEQTFDTIAPHTLEEAYEVTDAIARKDYDDLRKELGDLLLQVVFHARMAEEAGLFTFADVAQAIVDKLVVRHPHVFGGEDLSRAAFEQRWEEEKRKEREAKGDAASALDGIPVTLPAMLRMIKLRQRAGSVGFKWNAVDQVLEKLQEEITEVRECLATEPGNTDHLEDEVGDVINIAAHLALVLNLNPEQALARANHKFERRFRAMEQMAAEDGATLADKTLEEQTALWGMAKVRDPA